MKKIFNIIIICGFVACQTNGTHEELTVKTNPMLDINLDTVAKTTVIVLDSIYNFGTIKEGDTVMREYRFVNSGNKPLIIKIARASCGCTVVDRPDKPLIPGDTGSIKATFNSKGRGGEDVFKQVFVTSNADPEFLPFKLTGKVEKLKK
ncbi:MAG TPA: DUF1573 domain-containing protein [Chitinophagaceae bacterium]|nr:DUF1573 domain-containing protein [Chitinophagaceae bacterium]